MTKSEFEIQRALGTLKIQFRTSKFPTNHGNLAFRGPEGPRPNAIMGMQILFEDDLYDVDVELDLNAQIVAESVYASIKTQYFKKYGPLGKK